MDGQTDGFAIAYSALSMLSHAKNPNLDGLLHVKTAQLIEVQQQNGNTDSKYHFHTLHTTHFTYIIIIII